MSNVKKRESQNAERAAIGGKKTTWECEICGHKNEDSEEICEECGCLREEPCYDQMDDAGEE
jgi:membrane protease subunit (stomatin/prohibitin family)